MYAEDPTNNVRDASGACARSATWQCEGKKLKFVVSRKSGGSEEVRATWYAQANAKKQWSRPLVATMMDAFTSCFDARLRKWLSLEGVLRLRARTANLSTHRCGVLALVVYLLVSCRYACKSVRPVLMYSGPSILRGLQNFRHRRRRQLRAKDSVPEATCDAESVFVVHEMVLEVVFLQVAVVRRETRERSVMCSVSAMQIGLTSCGAGSNG